MAIETVESFLRKGTAEESNWRSIVLFGRNVASYKFALAKSLIDLANEGRDSVTLEQLAIPYTRHLCEHLTHSPKQATSRSSRFIDTCKAFNEHDTSEDQLISTAVQLGFNNVLDAFHVVNQNNLPLRFFEKDFSKEVKRLTLTDAMFRLASSEQAKSILQETESRWNLVETAWEMGISASLLSYDNHSQQIIVDNGLRRKNVTSVRGALNGYQKGHCFYCYADISAADEGKNEPALVLNDEPSRYEYALVSLGDEEREPAATSNDSDTELCDVDHFYPHVLGRTIREVNFDGVWNLVLACKDCNRGEGGKFARIPASQYIDRLHARNEYLILSHHPLRNSLIAQTGGSPQDRWRFLKRVDSWATELLPGERWHIEQRSPAVF